jgi:hypothetical protein
MEIILIILSVLALIFAYILFIPISISVDINIEEKVSTISGIRAFPFEHKFTPGKPKRLRQSKKERPSKNKETERLSQVDSQINGKKLDYSRISLVDIGVFFETISELFRFLGRLFRIPDYNLSAELTGGFPEPDNTGQLYGFYQALRPVFPGGVSVEFQPDFLSERIEGRVNLRLIMRLFNLLKEILIFIFRLPIIRLIKIYRKIKV